MSKPKFDRAKDKILSFKEAKEEVIRICEEREEERLAQYDNYSGTYLDPYYWPDEVFAEWGKNDLVITI